MKEYAPIVSLQFSPVAPYDFAVTSATRVQIYSSKTHEIKKTISRFKDTAYGASYRQDGRLMCAGDASGTVQVFDLNSRAVLRSFTDGHTDAVQRTQFLSNNTHVASVSDDCSVCVWDIPSQSLVQRYQNEHSDSVRALTVSRTNANMFFTGSYDHTVKLWDTRSPTCCMTMTHSLLSNGQVKDRLDAGGVGMPVEAVLAFPGDAVVLSAAGSHLVAWDILGGAGGRIIYSGSNHQKTITSMSFDGSCSRVLTGSLDQHVKVYDTSDYRVTYSFKYPSPVLSVALSPDDTHVVAGMINGLLSIRERVRGADSQSDVPKAHDPFTYKPPTANISRHEREMQFTGGSYKFFMRGQYRQAGDDDAVIDHVKKPKLKSFERYLKSFQYGQALDEALSSTYPPVIIMSLLEEFIRRGDGLKIALSSRDDTTLEPILHFIHHNLILPRYIETLMIVLECILDLYRSVAHTSPIITELLKKIRRKTREEINLQKELTQMVGVMDMMMQFSDVSSLQPEVAN